MLAIAPKQLGQTSVADMLPWAMEVDDGILMCKDGGFLCGFILHLPDVPNMEEQHRDWLTLNFVNALSQLDAGWSFHFDLVRKPHHPADTAEFPDPITQHIDDERVENFNADAGTFDNEAVFVIRWSPPKELERRFWSLFERRRDPAEEMNNRLEMFRANVGIFADSASALFPLELLATNTSPTGVPYSAILTWIAECLWDDPKSLLSSYPYGAYVDCQLATVPIWLGKRPFVAGKKVQCICVDGFPPATHPALLSALAELPFPFRWSTRFIQMSPERAQKMMNVARKTWEQTSRSFVDQYFGKNPMDARQQEGMAMIADIDAAQLEGNELNVRYGLYSSTFLLRHENEGVLDAWSSELRTALTRLGCRPRVEELNAVEAFFGTLPGDLSHNLRRPILHNLHFLNLTPLTNVWEGESRNPSPLIEGGSGQPHLTARTIGQGSFDFNLHEGDVGHSLVFGYTGSGKSVLLATLAAQFRRYKNARVVIMDKGQSMRLLTMGVGGEWLSLGLDEGAGFAPLKTLTEPDQRISEADQLWAVEWITGICRLNDLYPLSQEQRRRIVDGVRLISEPGASRSLLDLRISIQDEEIQTILANYSGDGNRGGLFDSHRPANPFGAVWTCYESEDLLQLDETTLTPLLLYIFRMIEKNSTGMPTLVVLDEAWALLRHEMFREHIETWLRTMRKKNVAVVLATQSLTDALNSGMMEVLLESCPTKIFGANPEVASVTEQYEALGLSQIDTSTIQSLTPKRQYYVVKGGKRKVFSLDLTPYALRWVGVSDPTTISEAVALSQIQPDTWREEWSKVA